MRMMLVSHFKIDIDNDDVLLADFVHRGQF